MALFSANKPDHPMSDIRQAKKLISELPLNDTVKALDEATFWFESLRNTYGFKLEYFYELIDLIDQATKIPQRRITLDYLATDTHEKFREQKLWNAMSDFWKGLGNAYVHCVEQSQEGMSGAGALKKELPIIIGRALRALTAQMKCTFARYGAIDSHTWAELGKLYRTAEVKGVQGANVEFYPGVQGQGNVREEFLKALMLSMSSTDGLTPLRQHIAERTIAHYAELFSLHSQAGLGCHYFFDLSASQPAADTRKKYEPRPSLRFFGAGKALPALQQLMPEIKSKNSIPADFNLGATYDTELVLSVMQHLAMYWADNRPERHSERRPIASRLTVVHGFRNLLRSVDPTVEDDNSLNFDLPEGSESWIVENVSEGGLGAIIPQTKSEWLKIGTLIGVHSETARYWGAGVVRRITHDDYQQYRVGILLLSKTVIPVEIAPDETASSLNPIRETEPAILLSTSPNAEGEIALLMRESGFMWGQPFEMVVRGKKYHLAPGKLVEGGEDFDWAKFKVLPGK